MNSESIGHIRNLVSDSGRRMRSSGLVAGTWGNISIRVDFENMIIKIGRASCRERV